MTAVNAFELSRSPLTLNHLDLDAIWIRRQPLLVKPSEKEKSHAIYCPGLSGWRTYHPEPLHPTRASTGVFALGSALCTQRTAASGRHGAYLRRSRNPGRGEWRLGGAGQSVRPLDRARIVWRVRFDVAGSKAR